jgi:uracil-DNA glycosylase
MELLHSDIKSSWLQLILDYHNKTNFLDNIKNILDKTNYYPNKDNIFECFKYFELDQIKCVLLGQDPYINEENNIPQATGLSFSVDQQLKKLPPSLKNIFIELKSDLGCTIPKSGNLINWVKNGVLLLNASLTVEKGKSGSHMKLWEGFTDFIIKSISERTINTVFILLGNFAKSKKKLINLSHCIIEAVHPSPLSASQGFFGSKIFSKTNKYLVENEISEIDWHL